MEKQTRNLITELLVQDRSPRILSLGGHLGFPCLLSWTLYLIKTSLDLEDGSPKLRYPSADSNLGPIGDKSRGRT